MMTLEDTGAHDGFDDAIASARPVWDDNPWPMLHERALHGVAGDIVRTITPETEADPAAMLFQLLTMAGVMIGDGPYLRIGPRKHPPLIYTLVVGRSSLARKGQSFTEVRDVVERADGPLFRSIYASGLSSGEGLISRFKRDPQEMRALFVESEMARVFAASKREGNTLSPIIRAMWDRDPMSIMTKKDPIEVEGAFGAIIGHITIEELHSCLTGVDIANGFGNRFLFVGAKRGKLLPMGGKLPESVSDGLACKLRWAIRDARAIGEVRCSLDFERAYDQLYRTFPEEDGIVGSLLVRGSTQTLRLSLLYALLDGSRTIELDHLIAGFAAWRYAEDTARYLFFGKLGNDVRDKLLREVRAEYPSGLDRTQQSKLFSGHKEGSRLEEEREWLISHRFAEEQRLNSGGAPRRILVAIPGLHERPNPLVTLISLNSHIPEESETRVDGDSDTSLSSKRLISLISPISDPVFSPHSDPSSLSLPENGEISEISQAIFEASQ